MYLHVYGNNCIHVFCVNQVASMLIREDDAILFNCYGMDDLVRVEPHPVSTDILFSEDDLGGKSEHMGNEIIRHY